MTKKTEGSQLSEQTGSAGKNKRTYAAVVAASVSSSSSSSSSPSTSSSSASLPHLVISSALSDERTTEDESPDLPMASRDKKQRTQNKTDSTTRRASWWTARSAKITKALSIPAYQAPSKQAGRKRNYKRKHPVASSTKKRETSLSFHGEDPSSIPVEDKSPAAKAVLSTHPHKKNQKKSENVLSWIETRPLPNSGRTAEDSATKSSGVTTFKVHDCYKHKSVDNFHNYTPVDDSDEEGEKSDGEEEEKKGGGDSTSSAKSIHHVAKRSKKEMPPGYVHRAFKIKLKPSKESKGRFQQWFRTCRMWRKLILAKLKEQNPAGFQKAPNWKNAKKWINPCECADVKKEEKRTEMSCPCEHHPFKDHPQKHFLFNLPHPDPKKKGLLNNCPKDMKVATIHKLCSSIGSTIEALKEKKRAQGKKCSRSEIWKVEEFDMTDQTQQDRCQTVYIECNGGTPSITWDASRGFSFNVQANPKPVPAKSKRDYKKLFKLFQQHNLDFPLKKAQRSGIVGCPFSVSLKYDRHHGYFLCIPYWKKQASPSPDVVTTRIVQTVLPCANKDTNEEEKESESSTARVRRTTTITRRSGRMLALATDPGVRTFQTTYDSGGNSVKYGYRSVARLVCLAKKMDRLQSRLDRGKKGEGEGEGEGVLSRRERRALKRAYNCMAAKIDNLKADVHWKLARKWCSTAEHIMIPIFKVSQMINRFKRCIRASTVREMLHWSHFAFRQRLKCKAEELLAFIHEVTEEYTSTVNLR